VKIIYYYTFKKFILNLLASKLNGNKDNNDAIENKDEGCSSNRSNIFIIYLFIYSFMV